MTATTAILPAGNGPSQSLPFTLGNGEETTLSVFPAAGTTLEPSMKPLVLAKQASNGNWVRTRTLLSFKRQIQVVRGEGTYRLERDQQPGTISVGGDRY